MLRIMLSEKDVMMVLFLLCISNIDFIMPVSSSSRTSRVYQLVSDL